MLQIPRVSKNLYPPWIDNSYLSFIVAAINSALLFDVGSNSCSVVYSAVYCNQCSVQLPRYHCPSLPKVGQQAQLRFYLQDLYQ